MQKWRGTIVMTKRSPKSLGHEARSLSLCLCIAPVEQDGFIDAAKTQASDPFEQQDSQIAFAEQGGGNCFGTGIRPKQEKCFGEEVLAFLYPDIAILKY